MKSYTMLARTIVMSWGLACAALGETSSAGSAACRVPPKAEPFDLADVTLLDGPFKHAQEINRQLLITMDFDWLMHPFRQVAGLPTSVECPKLLKYDLTGHTAGHYLSACALHYRNTKDDAVKQKGDAVVAELARCQDKIGTGFLGGFPERSMQVYARLVDDPAFNAAVPWYCLHKIYAGLLDMYVLTGNRQALEVLLKVVAWTEKYTSQFTNEALQGMLRAEHGGICEFWSNLYAATGDARCLSLAQRFIHQELVAPAARGEDLLDGKHANTQVPKFSSAARLYQLDGNPTNLLAAANFWRCVVSHHSFVTGGNSYAEYFRRDLPAYLGTRNSESCNEYNMLKLTRYLFNVDPLAAYADYYERTLYNHVLSSRHPQTGGQLYFQPLQSGHIKGDPQVNTAVMGWRFLFNKHAPEGCKPGTEMCCCSGSGLESNAKYADSIYFHQADKDLYVNLFIPSTLEWTSTGIKLRQETRYPEQAATTLLLECRKPTPMTLHLRRPGWATEAFEILVNGARQEVAVGPSSYVPLARTWQSGDKVEVRMPMRFRMEGFKAQPTRAAVMYGPLVMAAVTDYGNPFSAIVAKDDRFLDTLKPVEGKPLEFTGAPEAFRLSPLKTAEGAVTFRPLYQTFETPYAIYWDVMAPEAFSNDLSQLEAELRRLKEPEPRTVDLVLCYPGNEIFTFQSQLLAQPGWLPRPSQQILERAHGVKEKKNSRKHYPWRLSEMFLGYKGEFRFLEPDTWCSYRMKVRPDQDQALEIMIWKSTSNADNALLKQGRLEVVAEGKVLGTCEPSTFPAGQFTKVAFPLPAALIKAKKSVEILLRVPEKSQPVSGIYECRIVTTMRAAPATAQPLPGMKRIETDVCVYGGASGGVAAAVQAARQGKRVALLVFNNHLGGLSSSGLGWTDIGSLGDGYIQGLSREFYERIGKKYGVSKAKWMFEPHVAESVFNDLVQEAGVSVFFGERLARTILDGQKITQINMENGDVFQAKIFIDASYEGDLLKQAGVSYTVGRESNAQYGETLNGIQTRTHGNQLPNGIDPYKVKGNPASGLLPGVHADAGGPDGSADTKIQAYCYRMCLTREPSNRIPITQPPGYNEADYELLFRAIEAGQTSRFFKVDPMPKGKTDSNNASGISCDYIGFNYDYPVADYATRARIAKAHENWQRGLLWTLQNHLRVPETIRKAHADWGLPADEFKDNNHWPYELYVREARRMVSDHVMTEKDCTGGVVAEDSVGLAAYTMDSHNCQRIVLKGFVKNEGDVQKALQKPFPISYRSLVPKAGECSNLLVPWCVSATHVAFASLRMEPVFMIVGQSAGSAACLAIDEACPVQKVPYSKLKDQLTKNGQCLTLDASKETIK